MSQNETLKKKSNWVLPFIISLPVFGYACALLVILVGIIQKYGFKTYAETGDFNQWTDAGTMLKGFSIVASAWILFYAYAWYATNKISNKTARSIALTIAWLAFFAIIVSGVFLSSLKNTPGLL
jgi:hypothetical protein